MGNCSNKPNRPTTVQVEPELHQPLTSHRTRRRRRAWWPVVALHFSLFLTGQCTAAALRRFYLDQGGQCHWLQALSHFAGFPLLFLPRLLLLLLQTTAPSSPPTSPCPPLLNLSLIYAALGFLIAADSLLHYAGRRYLPDSVYSLPCATQLGFNAAFSFFINGERLTELAINSVILLTLSTALIGARSSSTGNHPNTIGIVLVVAASALRSLVLSVMEMAFRKVVKSRSLAAVLDMQLYTAVVPTAVAVAGLLASGDWWEVREDMEGFKKGRLAYGTNILLTAVMWQVRSVGLVGLVSEVSSLFSSGMIALGACMVPVMGMVVYSDRRDGVKVIALLLAVWGSASFWYQQHLSHKSSEGDDDRTGKQLMVEGDCSVDASLLLDG